MSGLILGSGSPRRAVILKGMGVAFATHTADIDESQLLDEDPVSYVRRLAECKARTVLNRYADGARSVLGADTIVTIDGELLGKPVDPQAAQRMLMRLSNRTHQVITAFAVCDADGDCAVHHEATGVTFRALDIHEIEAYVATGSPMDKAGAYGIQDAAGAFVERIDGSFSNVVGLPVEALTKCFVDRGLLESGMSARLSLVQGRIAAAAGDHVKIPTLVAVSKGHELAKIEHFQAMGLTVFGESYVQEWESKIAGIAQQPIWHYIGRIQSNKLKRIVQTGALIHTVCSRKHLSQIQKHSCALDRVTSCLLQVRLGDEESKAGVESKELGDLVSFAETLSHVQVRGLMTLPPRGDFGVLRNYFRTLSDLGVRYFGADVELSMGMSSDLEAAMSQGATLIRVGTALFGARE